MSNSKDISNYSLFRPKTSQGLKYDYPEIFKQKEFVSLTNKEVLMVWYFACEGSPYNGKEISDKQKIKEILKDHYKNNTQIHREQNAKCIEVLKKAGIEVVRSDPDDETSKFVLEAAKKARESLVGKLYSKELLERTLSLLREYREKNPDSEIMRIK